MIETTTVKGTWWLPERPDRKLPGELTHGSTSGASLSVFGDFHDGSLEPDFTVFGEMVNGRLATLFNCHTEAVTGHLSPSRTSKVASFFGVIGSHYPSPGSMFFSKVVARLSYLLDWASMTGIMVEFNPETKEDRITHRAPTPVDLGQAKGLRVKLEIWSNCTHNIGNVSLREECILVFDTDQPLAFETFEEMLFKIQDFIALGTGKAVQVLSFEARTSAPKYYVEKTPVYEEIKCLRNKSVKRSVRRAHLSLIGQRR